MLSIAQDSSGIAAVNRSGWPSPQVLQVREEDEENSQVTFDPLQGYYWVFVKKKNNPILFCFSCELLLLLFLRREFLHLHFHYAMWTLLRTPSLALSLLPLIPIETSLQRSVVVDVGRQLIGEKKTRISRLLMSWERSIGLVTPNSLFSTLYIIFLYEEVFGSYFMVMGTFIYMR